MKFSAFALLCLIAKTALGEEDCTHGKLYVLDDTTSDVHVIDVSEGNLEGLTVETKVTLPAAGAGNLVYYGAAGDPLYVQYRGEEETFVGSFVRVIDTGFSYESHGDHGHVSYSDPFVVQNALIDDCRRPIHQVRHDGKVAVFCDGSFDDVPQVNTTVHVVDNAMLSATSDESAIVHFLRIEGAHHGVAIPVDDGHTLHSLALQERIDRDPNVTSLPSTFQVVNFEGDILHEIADTTDPDTHCSGFHGSATQENLFVLACDDVHGGVVVVDYDPTTETYTSRAILYPDGEEFDGFRIGSFAYHYKNNNVVGSYTVREGTEFHLAVFDPSTTALTTDNLLTLPGNERQCAFQFEAGKGEHLLVLMPNGVLHVFEIASDGSFTEVLNKEIVAGMTACTEATFVAGIGQAFVATPADRTIYAIDLGHVEDKEMEVFTTVLPFTPTGMMVSGFSLEAACTSSHEHPEPTEAPATSGANMVSMGLLTVLAAAAFIIV